MQILLFFPNYYISFLFASVPPESDPSTSSTTHGCFRKKPIHHRLSGTQRSNYDLRERICIGSMTALEMAAYQHVPTDEAEAQMLASVDLDDMKSECDITEGILVTEALIVFVV